MNVFSTDSTDILLSDPVRANIYANVISWDWSMEMTKENLVDLYLVLIASFVGKLFTSHENVY